MVETPRQSSNSKVWVVIPAAGIGQRMLSKVPKQYLTIKQKTIIEHTLSIFIGHADVAGIVVVLNNEDTHWQSLDIDAKSTPLFTVTGGSDRTQSVIQGLTYLIEKSGVANDSWVMVHDAARPCLSRADLDNLLKLRHSKQIGGILATPVSDTMKRAKANDANQAIVSHTESRENLWHALTPQMFRLAALIDALGKCQTAEITVTDECSAMEYIGESPMIVACTNNNLKITQVSDLSLASYLLETQDTEDT